MYHLNRNTGERAITRTCDQFAFNLARDSYFAGNVIDAVLSVSSPPLESRSTWTSKFYWNGCIDLMWWTAFWHTNPILFINFDYLLICMPLNWSRRALELIVFKSNTDITDQRHSSTDGISRLSLQIAIQWHSKESLGHNDPESIGPPVLDTESKLSAKLELIRCANVEHPAHGAQPNELRANWKHLTY